MPRGPWSPDARVTRHWPAWQLLGQAVEASDRPPLEVELEVELDVELEGELELPRVVPPTELEELLPVVLPVELAHELELLSDARLVAPPPASPSSPVATRGV
jgi:hypothetical protein